MVYDDCSEVRRKINHFLKENLMTKAAFLRVRL